MKTPGTMRAVLFRDYVETQRLQLDSLDREYQSRIAAAVLPHVFDLTACDIRELKTHDRLTATRVAPDPGIAAGVIGSAYHAVVYGDLTDPRVMYWAHCLAVALDNPLFHNATGASK